MVLSLSKFYPNLKLIYYSERIKQLLQTYHRVLLLSKSKKINCRLEFCTFLASTGHTEANVVPEKLIYRYTYELPAKTHCPDGPLGSIFWCYLGQPSKMAR